MCSLPCFHRSKALEALDELNPDVSPRNYAAEKTWQPPNLRKSSIVDYEKDSQKRSKSPGLWCEGDGTPAGVALRLVPPFPL